MLDADKIPDDTRRWCELHAEMYPKTTQVILNTVVSVPELEKVRSFLDTVSAQMIENGRDFTPEEMAKKSSTETERVIAIAYLAERQELS